MNTKTAQELLKKVKEDYNKISEEFHQTRQHGWSEFNQAIKYIKNSDEIIDIGCGNGRFYSYLRDKRNCSYLGIDNNKDLIKKASHSFKNTKFKLGDILKIPQKDGNSDFAASIASIHHIPSKELREKAIIEISRVIKKNGTLFLTAWNLFQPKYKKYIWQSRLRHIYSFGKYDWHDTFIPWGKSGVKRYYYAFTGKELRKLLSENGFKILEEKTGNNFVFICTKK